MNITIFGATGRTGVLLAELALAGGHKVTAFGRNTTRLDHLADRITIVQGDVGDPEAIAQAVEGADVIISTLGPSRDRPGTPISLGMRSILEAMRAARVRRLVAVAGAGVGDPHDQPRLIDRLMGALLKLMARSVYEDMKSVADMIRSSDLEWSLLRAPRLTDDPTKPGQALRIGYLGQGVGSQLSRADLAAALLREAETQQFLRRSPVLSN